MCNRFLEKHQPAGRRILFYTSMPNNKSGKPATRGQFKAGQPVGSSRPRNGQQDPYSSAIALENWFDLIMEDRDRLRPFIVTTASGGDLNGLGCNEARLEAEEL
jgi:hypothetical protein